MPRIHVNLDDDLYALLQRQAERRGGMSSFLRRAIIETATRDSLRAELEVMRQELIDARTQVFERLERIERVLGIGDSANR